MQSEQERHNIGHMKYLCDRASPESPEVCFDYTLVQDVLAQFERLTAESEKLKSAMIQVRGFAAVMGPNNWHDLRLHIERQTDILEQ